MLIRLLAVALCLAFAGPGHAGRLLTTPDFSLMQIDAPGPPVINKVLPLPDGGFIVAGRFFARFEGKLFTHVLRFRPDGLPDTNWRVDVQGTAVCDATLTPTGVMLCVTVEAGANSSESRLLYVAHDGTIIASDSGSLTTVRRIAFGRYYSPQSYVLALFDGQVTRIDIKTGRMMSRLPYRPFQWGAFGGDNSRLGVDAGGGVWITGCGLLFSWKCGAQRYVVPETYQSGDTVLYAQSTVYGYPRSVALKFLANSTHAFVGASRIDRDGRVVELLAPYGSDNAGGMFEHVDEKYAYYRTTVYPGFYLRSPHAQIPPENPAWIWTKPAGNEHYRETGHWLPVSADDVAQIMVSAEATGDPRLFAVAVARMNSPIESDLTVVEYYLPELKRYFITGRRSEQNALDAMPQSFRRTGMTFVAKSSRYRDIPEQPVCRLYFPPASGGSNTHFYGLGRDCLTLNGIGGTKYEGYDFSVLKPVGGSCAADAPHAVTRLYNNKAATNESNHRYVTSEATKARMLAQGWIDEGPVFCVSSFVDAAN